ncbi:MAG: PAS domain S-box protein, partial [Planctomycetota bacterium]
MAVAAIPANEADRLRALHLAEIMDTAPEEAFDLVVQIASEQLDVPIAAVSLIDAEREWLKACVGPATKQIDRGIAMCAHVIAADEPVVVGDATKDARFADNPQVTESGIRAYLGVPVRGMAGQAIGVLCVKDVRTREFTDRDVSTMRLLARQAEREIEQRLIVRQALHERSVVQSMLDASLNAMLVVEPILDDQKKITNFRSIAANQAVERLLDINIDEDAVIAVERVMNHPLLGPVVSIIEETLATGRQHQIEIVLHEDQCDVDNARTWTASVSLYRGGVLLEFNELTNMRQAEVALRESEDRFKAITEAALDAIVMVDEQGRIDYWNPAAAKIFGWELDEVRGRVLHDLVVPESYREAAHRGYSLYQEHGTGPAIGAIMEVEACARDGRQFPVELSLNRMIVNDRSWAIGIIRDVTQRKQAEVRLAASEARLRDIAESMSDWIWETDDHLTVVHCSERVADVLGISPDEIIGRNILDVIGDYASDDAFVPTLRELEITRTPIRDIECWMTTPNGNRVCMLYNGRATVDSEGRFVGYRGVA